MQNIVRRTEKERRLLWRLMRRKEDDIKIILRKNDKVSAL